MTTQLLPANIDAERLLLGQVLVNPEAAPAIMDSIVASEFSLEKHRRIFGAMRDVLESGIGLDYAVLASVLNDAGHLESVDGVSYIVDLTAGMPRVAALDGYIRTIKEKATLRAAIHAAQGLINRCMAATDNPGEILAEADAVLQRLAEAHQRHSEWLNPGEVIEAHPGGYNGFMEPKRGGIGLELPWPSVNSDLCGLHSGDLVIVAGRPSMGKSLIGMQVAHHAAVASRRAAFFSLEMSKDSLIKRLISSVGRVDAQAFRKGTLNREERGYASRAASDITDLPLWIDDSRARTVPAMSAAIRKLAARKGTPHVVIIDHLQLMRGASRSESRHNELSEICHSLKHLAGDFECCVVLLSQLNRQCEIEQRRPRLSDLKETGSIEEDADVVWFVHRPEQYKRDDPSLHGLAEFIIAKQRNGPTGKRNMVFLHNYQRFEERCEE